MRMRQSAKYQHQHGQHGYARADAGLTRAWIMIAIGVVVALLFGFAMTRYYDRKGLRRLAPP